MISHGKDIKIFCGNANQPLAEEICRMMGYQAGRGGGQELRRRRGFRFSV